jgi:hypothetical protein
MILIGGVLSRYGAQGGPISGVRTGWPCRRRPPRLASTDRLQGLIHCAKRRREVLRFVGSPHVAGRADAYVHLQLRPPPT